jgi:hypothetical protein
MCRNADRCLEICIMEFRSLLNRAPLVFPRIRGSPEPTAEAACADINVLPLWEQASFIGRHIAASASYCGSGGKKPA